MKFQTPLMRATLLRRYKRFLADIRLEDGREVTAHCANPGAMTGLAEPGMTVWAEPNDDPGRKLKFSWKLAELPGGHMACVDTSLPNRLVAEALAEGRISELAGYDHIRPEVKYGENSRVDFLATGAGRPDCYVEVKAVTLCREPGLAEFPDTRTARGTKHLQELVKVMDESARAVMLYVVHRDDCARVTVAADIDPAYGRAWQAAREAGVEMLARGCEISPRGVTLGAALPVIPFN